MCYDAHRGKEDDTEEERSDRFDRDNVEVKDLTDDQDELIRLIQQSGLVLVKRNDRDRQRERTS